MKKWGLLLAALLMLSACSEGANPSPEQDEPGIVENNDHLETYLTEFMIAKIHEQLNDPPPLPESEEEIYEYNAGIFAGKRPAFTLMDNSVQSAQIRYALDLLPHSPDSQEPDWEKHTKYLYSLFKESFPNPQDYANHWLWELGPDQDPRTGPLANSGLDIQVALDLSPPMQNLMGEHTYVEVSRTILSQFTELLPENSSISLWLFGGENNDEGECGPAQLIYDADQVEPVAIHELLQEVEPELFTPSEASGASQLLESILQKSNEADSQDSGDKTTLLYVISSGASPCAMQDAETAESFAAAMPNTKIHWVGFQVDAEGKQHLLQVADKSDGWYQSAAGPQDLLIFLQQAAEWAERWDAWQQHFNHGGAEPEVPAWEDVVYEWSRQWDERSRRQRGSLENALMYLNSEGRIPRDAFDHVQNFLLAQYDWLTEIHEQRYEELTKQNPLH